jgi:hypothetical protein
MAKLSPIGNNAQFINGIPATGAKLFFYAAGSSTKQTTYADEAGLIPQTNPIVLDSRGEPAQPIWLTEGLAYKVVFTASTDTDPPTSPIWDVDNVTGINDASVNLSQWIDSGVTPTYVSATSFTVPGDQTTAIHANRRFKATVTAGTVYGYISTSAFGALTTVTVTLDSGSLDTGLSAIQLGILTFNNYSIPAISGQMLKNSVFNDLTTSTPELEDYIPFAETDDSGNKKKTLVSALLSLYPTIVERSVPVRQTVLSGTVDTNGLPSFGGATGATTVTTSTTLTVTAANGTTNRTGSIVNPAWTGLSTNGTMYLFIDIAADGTCTTGSGTLAPTYRWGGADVTTNNQFTFNIQEMSGKVGNGTTAAQTYRVYVGQITVAGGVVTAITWYALMGRYRSPLTVNLPAVTVTTTYSHNLGVDYGVEVEGWAINKITENGFAVGSQVRPKGLYIQNSVSVHGEVASLTSTTSLILQAGSNSTGWITTNRTTGGAVAMTAANWDLYATARRTW